MKHPPFIYGQLENGRETSDSYKTHNKQLGLKLRGKNQAKKCTLNLKIYEIIEKTPLFDSKKAEFAKILSRSTEKLQANKLLEMFCKAF